MVNSEKVVVTVLGQDRVGIVSGISTVLAENNVNIVDLTSTKMRGLFVMVMLVDMSNSKVSLDKLQDQLDKKGKKLGVQVKAQHEDIFRYMHRI